MCNVNGKITLDRCNPPYVMTDPRPFTYVNFLKLLLNIFWQLFTYQLSFLKCLSCEMINVEYYFRKAQGACL